MFNSTSASKTDLVKVFNHLGLEVPKLDKANYGLTEATSIVFAGVNSVALPLTTTVYLDLIIKNIVDTTIKSGNYSKDSIFQLIQIEWEKVEKELHNTPIYRKAVKEWVKTFYSHIGKKEFHKLKDLEVEAYVLAIKALLPLL